MGAKSPPLLLVQGDQDTGVPVKHALHLAKRAREVGASLELVIVKNAGHNWRQAASAAIEPSLEVIERKTADFITQAPKRREKSVIGPRANRMVKGRAHFFPVTPSHGLRHFP